MVRSPRWSSGWLTAVALALAGCGGPTRNPGSFQGTVGGMTLDVNDSLFLAFTDTTGESVLMVVMTDKPGLCEALKTGHGLPSMTYFLAALADSSDPSAFPTPGDFSVSVGPSKHAQVLMNSTGAGCGGLLEVGGADGTVTLDQYEAQVGGSMTGSFDVTFGSAAEHATGDFDAAFCDTPYHQTNGCQ